MGSPRSRHAAPMTTADRPSSDPTDRSIPPVTITGVKARASRPISTLARATSAALPRVRKLEPMTPKTAISPEQQQGQDAARAVTRAARRAGSATRPPAGRRLENAGGRATASRMMSPWSARSQ